MASHHGGLVKLGIDYSEAGKSEFIKNRDYYRLI